MCWPFYRSAILRRLWVKEKNEASCSPKSPIWSGSAGLSNNARIVSLLIDYKNLWRCHMQEQFVEIKTAAGVMEAFVTHPEENGPFPAVMIYMDIWGVR